MGASNGAVSRSWNRQCSFSVSASRLLASWCCCDLTLVDETEPHRVTRRWQATCSRWRVEAGSHASNRSPRGPLVLISVAHQPGPFSTTFCHGTDRCLVIGVNKEIYRRFTCDYLPQTKGVTWVVCRAESCSNGVMT